MRGSFEVDWSNPLLQRWIESISREGTRAVYKSAYRMYTLYTGMTPEQLVNEALEDVKRDPKEKTDIVKRRIIGFYNWLVTEAPNHGPRGKGKGVSSKLAHTYIGAIRSFYDTFNVVIKLKGRSSLPQPKVSNKRLRLTGQDVKKLLDHCRSLRDRAIILVMFQSGMDVSTLCSLRYGDVAKGLERNEHPLKIDLYRPKTGVEYYTFLGKDAVEALKAYLNDLRMKGIKLEYNDPLFLKEGSKTFSKEPITPNLIQKLMRELAVKSGFVDERMNGSSINPLSPHALRESFSSIMIGKGVPKTIVDFWLGHQIGDMARAYHEAKFEDVRQMYLEHEVFLTVSSGNTVEKVKEIEERERQLQQIINGLVAENLMLKEKITAVEEKLIEIERKLINLTKQTF